MVFLKRLPANQRSILPPLTSDPAVLTLEIWNIAAKTHFIIIRDDLPVGLAAAQIVHAAGESSPTKVPSGTSAVVLSVPTEEALRHIHEVLVEACVSCVLITEVDEPYAKQATAIGLEPVTDKKRIKKLLSRFPLYGKLNGGSPRTLENQSSPADHVPVAQLIERQV